MTDSHPRRESTPSAIFENVSTHATRPSATLFCTYRFLHAAAPTFLRMTSVLEPSMAPSEWPACEYPPQLSVHLSLPSHLPVLTRDRHYNVTMPSLLSDSHLSNPSAPLPRSPRHTDPLTHLPLASLPVKCKCTRVTPPHLPSWALFLVSQVLVFLHRSC